MDLNTLSRSHFFHKIILNITFFTPKFCPITQIFLKGYFWENISVKDNPEENNPEEDTPEEAISEKDISEEDIS